MFKKLRGVHPTAESSSAVCIIPRSQGYQNQNTVHKIFSKHIGWQKEKQILSTLEHPSVLAQKAMLFYTWNHLGGS